MGLTNSIGLSVGGGFSSAGGLSSGGGIASPLDPSTEAYVSAVRAAGGAFTGARAAIVNTFILAEKSAGNWALTADYWPLWGENSTQANMSLKGLRVLTPVGSPTFTIDRGYATDGIASYLDTNWIGSSLTLTSAQLSVYERTDVASGGTSAGVFNVAGVNFNIKSRTGSSTINIGILSTASGGAGASPSSLGFFTGQRSGSTFTSYKNGVLVATPALTGASVLPTRSLFIGARNDDGVAASFRASSFGFVVAGSVVNLSALYTNVQAWATAIGANV